MRLCAPDWYLCVQRQCPVCGIHKSEESFQRHPTCRECRSISSTSTANTTVSIDPSSFQRFFNHESTQGSQLSLIQRSSILTLHALGMGDDQVAELTGRDRRTIQHWVAYFQEHHSLGDEPRSGQPRVTSADTDTSIVAAAIKASLATP